MTLQEGYQDQYLNKILHIILNSYILKFHNKILPKF
jgi:hypothetical protein